MEFNNCSLIILAGGKSSRMGQNKAHLRWNAKCFLDIIIEKGKSLGFGEIVLSGYRGKVSDCFSVEDELKERGPLGGLHACFKAASFEDCFVITVDSPLVSTETMRKMLDEHIRGENEVTLLKHGEKTEPLIGIYKREFYRKIYPVIQNGSAPVFRALDRADVTNLEIDGIEKEILNINTKDAYEAFLKENENNCAV
ncbi:MAG TPA: molybdenum cofactor guanylyltransferase [Bacillota bacterium]|nr:molybdenum cofactor guanylyltransferase [Bacillota bacterium]